MPAGVDDFDKVGAIFQRRRKRAEMAKLSVSSIDRCSILVVAAFVIFSTSACTAAAEAQGSRNAVVAGYTVNELVDLYTHAALSVEVGGDPAEVGLIKKWAPDATVRIVPQPTSTIIWDYGLKSIVTETKRVGDILAAKVSHPAITTFDTAQLEEFAKAVRQDSTDASVRNSILVYIGTKDELIDQLRQIDSANPGIVAPPMLTALPTANVPICVGFLTKKALGDRYIYRGAVFIEYSDKLTACLFEELMQSFGISNDFPRGTPSIFNDDNVYEEPTELDWFLWRVHADPRLEAGLDETAARPIVREVVLSLLPISP